MSTHKGSPAETNGLPKTHLAKILKRVAIVISAAIIIFPLISYTLAFWYQQSQKDKPFSYGTTFVPSYARYLGVDPAETLDAIINDLDVRQFRLVSHWNSIEKEPGVYDFSELDWQFKAIEKVGGSISLAVGLRQPRWPECHPPDFYDTAKPRSNWQPQLERFMKAVIKRYKDSPSLSSYQLENEFFLKSFGHCKNTERERLVEEFKLIKELDKEHPIILSRSNNMWGYALGQPRADIVGISIYRRVWDETLTNSYQDYPFPPWHYSSLVAVQALLFDQKAIIHELQAEPWPADGKAIIDVSLSEQNKTFDAKQFNKTLSYAKSTGIRHIDLWGAEYWYYRKTKLNDPSVWKVAENFWNTKLSDE